MGVYFGLRGLGFRGFGFRAEELRGLGFWVWGLFGVPRAARGLTVRSWGHWVGAGIRILGFTGSLRV